MVGVSAPHAAPSQLVDEGSAEEGGQHCCGAALCTAVVSVQGGPVTDLVGAPGRAGEALPLEHLEKR